MYRSLAYVVAAASLLRWLRRAAERHAERGGHQGGARAHADGRRRRRFSIRSTRHLEDKLDYLGMDVDTDAVTPGKAFTLTHYWKVIKPVGDDWKIFVHLEAPDSKKSHLNADHVPIGGKYPVQLVEEGRDHPRHPPRVGAAELAGQRGRDLRRRCGRGRCASRSTKGTARQREPRARGQAAGAVGGGRGRARSASSPSKVKNGAIKLDGKLDEAEWADAPSTGDVRAHDGRAAGRAEDRGQAAVGRQEPLRRVRSTTTRTSGPRSTSATTSCGPRRRTRCSSTPTATARPTSSCR